MENQNKYNAFSLLQFMWKWRKWLLIVCVATFFVSAACSFLVRSRYKSTALIYAPRTSSVSKILLNEQNYNERLEIKALATVDETEQMLPFLNSVAIKDSLIEKYKLAEYYNINVNKKGGMTKLYKTVTNNLTIKRTDYGAISVSVSDWDPQRAYEMTLDVIRWLDTIKNAVEYERAQAACTILQNQMDSVEREIAAVNDSIRALMAHGVFDVKLQSERLTQQYAIAAAQGNTAAMQRIIKEQDTLAKYGAQLTSYQDLEYNFSKYHALCKQKMMDAKMDMTTIMPVKFVIDKPFPADKKFYPKKSLIVVISTLCAFILTMIILLMIERIENTPVRKDPAADTQDH
jgi:LPS O-antigen subunit length determinant protein (WzzB/FepE family)